MTANYYIIPGIKIEITPRPVEIVPVSIFDNLFRIISIYSGIGEDVLLKRSRKREVVFARHLLFYFVQNKTDLTLESIGEPFGFDHTTVLHGIKKINGYLDIKDEQTCKAVEAIENSLR